MGSVSCIRDRDNTIFANIASLYLADLADLLAERMVSVNSPRNHYLESSLVLVSSGVSLAPIELEQNRGRADQ